MKLLSITEIRFHNTSGIFFIRKYKWDFFFSSIMETRLGGHLRKYKFLKKIGPMCGNKKKTV